MSEPKTYHITSVADFLGVPEDRLDDCLSEFRTVLRTFRLFEAVIGQELEPTFTWVDDGERTITVNVTVREPAKDPE